jgi:hypothetical protein
MKIVMTFKDGVKEIWHVVNPEDLATEIQAILAVQVSKFIDEIEHREKDVISIGSVYDVQFLDRCYSAA